MSNPDRITALFNAAINDIRRLAAEAMDSIDEAACWVIYDIRNAHAHFMHRMERADGERRLADKLEPFGGSIANWFDALSDEEKWHWKDRYQAYMYGPNGSAMEMSDDIFTAAIMGLLRSRDSYLQQPFCPYCDSRGHEPGACMPRRHAA
jgi:hypothetical protein